MLPKVREKLQQQHQLQPLLQKDDIKCRELIGNFKKSVELWFINGADDEITFGEIQDTCLEIILHGLHDPHEMLQINNKNINAINDSSPTTTSTTNDSSYTDLDLNALIKRIDDFEWILNAVSIRNNTKNVKCLDVASTPPSTTFNCSEDALPVSPSTLHNKAHASFLNRHRQTAVQSSNTSLLKLWLKEKLHHSVLGAFLQYLISDKELLDEHYSSAALLRQEKYVNALVIGLSALETYQYGLLTQIDSLLKESDSTATWHKRSNSQPNVIVLPPIKTAIVKASSAQHSIVLPTIRKTKSLPEFQRESKDFNDAVDGPRRRCKTIAGIKRKHTKPQNIPRLCVNSEKLHSLATSSGSSSYDDDQKPSTSHSSTSNRRNKSPISSLHLNSTASITSASTSTSMSSSNSNTTTRRIQLINTDDIKIWTDHSWESRKISTSSLNATPSQVIPKSNCLAASVSSAHKTSKSVSPLNSFFSSLFSTPPSYTSWYTDHNSQDDDELPETAVESITTDTSYVRSTTPAPLQTNNTSSLGSTVFDTFLPIYGKKLRIRNSQNHFDDVLTTMDYSTPVSMHSETSTNDEGLLSPPINITPTVKNCQSLTQFLQMSNLSRNNTELEKENAHFRISEAIISAIEHIKWNKQDQSKDKLSREATPLATDCLSSKAQHKQSTTIDSKSNDCIKGGEHVPYAEEVCLDQLSAEVVGLSLISKFDEKHLPKLSELKWLVSDDDTPQKLLPMPDLTSSANPDDHVLHSVTRGTKYWAPPRQQIIFTDHPTPNRKDLLKNQNFRCAGCGMRVSSQYIHSFRYCTYLGKYHCTGCHRNQISATPAKILQTWDFKCYPVSVFAYRLLEQMSTYPLFYVPDLNPALYYRSKALLSARNKRLQLKFVKDFIRTCRFALREQYFFESVPDYITSDVDNWSMADFIDARSNCLHRSIDELINKCENHISNCVLCTARGFLCEFCHMDSVIYPWDSRVERCDRCGSCFHRNCWKSISEICCRCQRIDKRREFDEIHDI